MKLVIILEYIEPEIRLDYYPVSIDNKHVWVLKIHSSNKEQPYMLKKQYNDLREGLCRVRKGSYNAYAKRKDFEDFYLFRETFEVELMENTLTAAAIYAKLGCARTSISIRNHTSLPVVLRYGMLTIYNKSGEELSRHRVYVFEKDMMGADFKLSLAPKEEKYGDVWVGFSSTDCLPLKLDEDGLTDERFVFMILFMDTNGREYINTIEDGFVSAQGDFLWKVNKRKKSK